MQSIPRNWLVNSEGFIQLEARGYVTDWDAWGKKITELIGQVGGKK